jgi:hypothetical protein
MVCNNRGTGATREEWDAKNEKMLSTVKMNVIMIG